MWLLVAGGVVLALLLANVQLHRWSARPEVYEVASATELEPFVRSWAQWTDERARIVVQHTGTKAEFEFRKRRHKSQSDEIVFRFRNADSTRPFFARVRDRLDRDSVQYELEMTPKRRHARAIAVALNASDILTPLAAVRLAAVTVDELQSDRSTPLKVWLDGRVRRSPDVPSIEFIAATHGYRAGEDLGTRVGLRLRRLLGGS